VFAVEVLQYIAPSIVYDGLRRVFGQNPDLGCSDDMGKYLTVHGRKYLPEGIRLRASAAKNRLALFNEGHIDFRLESYAMDGAEWGIQYAFPMLDKSLLEYAVRLPASFFMRHGIRRAVFREAMRDVLPEKVRTFLPKNRPFPSLDLRISEEKHELLAILDHLGRNSRCFEILDFDKIRTDVTAIPEYAEILGEIGNSETSEAHASVSPDSARSAVEFAQFLSRQY
jgi:asparagine synthase (glutamine-hydrolysing)